nr:MAG TPA: hypothetical protein [Caudoviricetes sp.]
MVYRARRQNPGNRATDKNTREHLHIVVATCTGQPGRVAVPGTFTGWGGKPRGTVANNSKP